MWLIIGLITGALILGVARSQSIKATWYEWLTGILGLLLLMFTINNFFGAQAEYEPMAASMFLLVTGLPAIILLVTAWRLAQRHRV